MHGRAQVLNRVRLKPRHVLLIDYTTFPPSRGNLSLSFGVLSDLALPLVGAVGTSPVCSCPMHVLFPLPINSFLSCCRAAFCRDAPVRVYLKNVHVPFFPLSFLHSTFCFFLFWAVCLLISVLSFCISASGFSFFFFLISQMLVSRF